MSRRPTLALGVSLVLLLLVALLPPWRAGGSEPALYFPDTGQTLRGPFLDFWIDQGRLRLLGFPISGELSEQGRAVQYFERARLEQVPAPAGERPVVQLGLLGREVLAGVPAAARAAVEPGEQGEARRFFEETGHSLAFGFKHFWERHGGLPAFGFPLTEEFDERGQTVQYFERARFEYRPALAGTPEEVQLGLVGREASVLRALPITPTARPAEALEWSPDLSERLLARLRLGMAAEPVAVEPFQVAVTATSVALRAAPTTGASEAGWTHAGHIARVTGLVHGEAIDGQTLWYRVEPDGAFLPAAVVAPFTPPAPPRAWAGRWIDVNLSRFILTVYDGQRPLRSALIIAGRKGRTPTGVFSIQRRVANETMDSATVGFPPGHPEYYYLRNVLYTQYFTGAGHAIHGNYWVHPGRFGQFLSNGCIGLRTSDALWVWQMATYGTPVHVHY